MLMLRFKFLTLLFSFNSVLYGQTYVGGGVSVGNKNRGPRLEMLTLKSFGFQTGLEWQKFNAFSFYVGGKICPFQKINDRNTFWVGMNFNQNFQSKPGVESNGKVYVYDLQRFRSVTPLIEYRWLFGYTEKSFGAIGVNLGYRYNIENIELTENDSSPNSSPDVQSRLYNYYSNPLDLQLSLLLFFR